MPLIAISKLLPGHPTDRTASVTLTRRSRVRLRRRDRARRRYTADCPMDPGELPEPIIESAPIAHDVAQRLCIRDPVISETCAWYHGFWQYLRVMGLNKTSVGHGTFFIDTLRSLRPRDATPRVLVSGSADYSMPAHVLFAFADAGTVDLTVVDRCETPLYLSRWYAER